MTEHAVPASELYTDDFAADPYPAFARMREDSPVCPVTSARFDSYLITGFDDAKAALTDPRLSKDLYGPGQHYLKIFGPNSEALNKNMLNADPPEHTRLRRITSLAAAPGRGPSPSTGSDCGRPARQSHPTGAIRADARLRDPATDEGDLRTARDTGNRPRPSSRLDPGDQ